MSSYLSYERSRNMSSEQVLNDYIVFLVEGGLSYDQKVELFQRLIDNDLLEQIDSRFQTQARNLIASGECKPKPTQVKQESESVNV